MPNYKLTLEYNGEKFFGSQSQGESNGSEAPRTVQGELEKAFETLFKEKIATTFSGRTDAGVHAVGQVVSFTSEQELEDFYKVSHQLNGILPEDMVVAKIKEAPENFNARFDANSREYLYKIFIRPQRPVLRLDSLAWEKNPLDFDLMAKHAKKFIGTHDFKKYAYRPEEEKGTDCTVFESELVKESKICYKYRIKANRFVRKMVRNIVGELIYIGKTGKTELEVNDEALISAPAPAKGLTLMKVEYN